MGRPALRGNRLYVPVASYCDKPDQDGYSPTAGSWPWTCSTRASSPRSTSPKGPNNMGGIWGYAGVTIDPRHGSSVDGNRQRLGLRPGMRRLHRRDRRLRRERSLELDADLNVVAWNRPEDVSDRRGQRLRRRAAALPAARLPAACRRQREERARLHLVARGSRRGPLWSARVGPDELDARSSPSRATRPSSACSSSPPHATTTRRGDPDVRRRRRLQGRPGLRASRAADVDRARRRARPEVTRR